MSLKDNVNYIKKELSTEEQFFEGFFKIERFFKKYKILLISVVIIFILTIIGVYVKGYFEQQNLIKSNIAFNKFLKNNNDTVALQEIKDTNKNLYDVALFIKSKSNPTDVKLDNKYLNSLIEYKNALKSKNTKELSKLSAQSEFLLKNFALFEQAVILVNEKKYQEAKNTLDLIDKNSQISDLVRRLNHYLIAK